MWACAPRCIISSTHNCLRRCHLLNFTTKTQFLDTICVLGKFLSVHTHSLYHNTYLKCVSGIRNCIIIELNVKIFCVFIFNILCMSPVTKHSLRKELVLSETSIKRRLVLNIQYAGLNFSFSISEMTD